jgi:hypothetical protein
MSFADLKQIATPFTCPVAAESSVVPGFGIGSDENIIIEGEAYDESYYPEVGLYEEDPFGFLDMDNNFANATLSSNGSAPMPFSNETVIQKEDPSTSRAEEKKCVAKGTGVLLGEDCFKYVRPPLSFGGSGKQVHMSHRLMYWAGIWYCAECGAWKGQQRAVLLYKQCTFTLKPAGAAALALIVRKKPPAPHVQLLDGIGKRPLIVKYLTEEEAAG